MLKIAVLVSGRGTNLQSIIDNVEQGKIEAEIALVVSDVQNAYALERARKYGIKTLFIDPKKFKNREEFDRQVVRNLRENGVGLVCLAGFMRLLSPYFVKEYRNRIMNIHPALLPSFPGTHGQRDALNYGVKISGCTVHFVDEECDTGPIIIQAAVPVKEGDTEDSLAARILEQEHKIYPRAIQLFTEGRLETEAEEVKGRRVKVKEK
jgi:phosphoribosylglycinamide formyltransferase-1